MEMTLARALTIRKELNARSTDVREIKKMDIYETRVKRISVTKSTDEVTADVAKLDIKEVMREGNRVNAALRAVDDVIQHFNHVTMVEIPDDVMEVVDSI